jgi:hypothetical protein
MIPPKIDSYKFGRIVIDGQAYSRDVIILPDRVIRDWWRDSGHILHPMTCFSFSKHPRRLWWSVKALSAACRCSTIPNRR